MQQRVIDCLYVKSNCLSKVSQQQKQIQSKMAGSPGKITDRIAMLGEGGVGKTSLTINVRSLFFYFVFFSNGSVQGTFQGEMYRWSNDH